jgi:hypothetical protein
MTEIPAGKICDYENIFDALRRELVDIVEKMLFESPHHFYPM